MFNPKRLLTEEKHSARNLKFEFFLEACWQRVNFVTDSNEHKAYGITREKLTFALRECCLLLLCAPEVIAATLAHVGLFHDCSILTTFKHFEQFITSLSHLFGQLLSIWST